MINMAASQELLDGMMEVEGLITWFGDINGKLHMAKLSVADDPDQPKVSE